MAALTVLAGVLSAGLLVYLGLALLFPEKLS
jgi:K+-transporting ATPase KdpF subunit